MISKTSWKFLEYSIVIIGECVSREGHEIPQCAGHLLRTAEGEATTLQDSHQRRHRQGKTSYLIQLIGMYHNTCFYFDH